MISWKWILIRVGAFLATAAAGSEALSYPVVSNTTSTSASTSTSTYTKTSTSAIDPTITSCGATIDITDFLAPSLRTLASSALIPILISEAVKIVEFQRNLASIQAVPTNIDAAVLSSYYSSLLSTVEVDITSLFGPAGNAILSFQSLATDPCLYTSCFSQFLAQSATFAVASPAGIFSYLAHPPCCQQCTVYGQAVQLEYWPTPPPKLPVSTLIDEATNYTFVSPSVYAIFTNLRASNLCGPVGGSYALETLAFGPSELSTSSFLVNPSLLPIFNPLGQWTAINYADFSPRCICTANCTFDTLASKYITNLCTPQLSLPAKVTALDPAWATCASDLGGVFDPPLALPLVSGLTTPKSTPAQTTPGGTSPLPIESSAAPANSATPPAPTPSPQPQISNQPTPQVNSPSPIPAQSSANPVILQPVTVDGTTSQLPPPSPVATVLPPPIIINGQTVTANSQSNYVIGTQTLIPGGPAITISGTAFSLAPGATVAAVGGTATGLGSMILSVFGFTTVKTSGIVSGTTLGAASGVAPGAATGAATGTAKGTAAGTTTVASPKFTGEASREANVVTGRVVFIGLALSALIVWL